MTTTMTAIRDLASRIRYKSECRSDLSWQLAELEATISKNEKGHRSGGRRDYAPLCHAVDLFLVRTIGDACKTLGRRKTIPTSAICVRADFLLALRLVAQHGHKLFEKTPYGNITRAELIKAAESADYCEFIAPSRLAQRFAAE